MPSACRQYQRLRAAATFLLLASLPVACKDDAPYRIGVVLNGDGVNGALAAANLVNANGGINGHKLEIRSLGGAASGSAQVALGVAEQLADDPQVLAVVGHANSAASIAASQVYNARHVVQVAPTTTAPIYSQAGPYSFRLVSSDAAQARFLADTIAAMHPQRLAMVYVNDDYGRALRLLVDSALARASQSVSYEAPYTESDLGGIPDLVASLGRTKPSMILWLGRASYYAHLAEDLRRALPGVAVIASDGFGGISVEGDSLGRFSGVRYVRLVNVARDDSAMRTFRTAYHAIAPRSVSDEAVLAFDAVGLLAAAIHDTGADREKVRDWLVHLGTSHPAYQGLSGAVNFTSSRDRQSSYLLGEVPPARARNR